MSDKPVSPFARLDTNLLRSTRTGAAVIPEERLDEPASPSPPASEVALVAGVRESKPTSAMASLPASKHASKRASALAPTSVPANGADEDLVEIVRRTVRHTGKEVGYVRMTPAEKAALKEIVYAYSRKGQRTSDTEVLRIAMNCAIEDYRRHGEASMLARVIAALLA